MMNTPYAELQVTTNFTFLEGASHPDELAITAAALGHQAIAITDRNSLAGVVQAHQAAKTHGLRLLVGCRLDLTDAASLLVFPTDRAAYARLSHLLTLGKRRAPKGDCFLTRADVLDHARGLRCVLVSPDRLPEGPDETRFHQELIRWKHGLGRKLYLAASHRYRGDDARRLTWLAALAERELVPMVATNDVLYHSPGRRVLADVLTCIREGVTIDEAGWRLAANAERHLKPGAEMARLFRAHPHAIPRTLEIADACGFSLDELRYEYPDEVVDDGGDAQSTLARVTWEGAAERYPPDLFPQGVPARTRKVIEHELQLIARLNYAPYFLTVHDIVRFARSRAILCQGRGSAANSAVCFCLGITEIDPSSFDLLFERFISAARDEPPDIDVDFEHERREEVIQYIYAKYGRDRAGLTATVIRYRTRGATREVGKVMGLSGDLIARLGGTIWGHSSDGVDEGRVREHGLDPQEPRLRQTLDLARELIGFPRHLSQHVGGFVITRGPLDELCPIANAAMDGRTTIEWDKDDIDALGILKVDVLALGMLSCVQKAFALLKQHHGRSLTMATVPQEVPAVYEMLGRADSIGVFQVESRAQMSMLPRLRPRCFYDLVIQVAIVRPGPIQGDMVHPYLRRRAGQEPVNLPSPELRDVLGKTLGVPLFQEQAMKIAIVAAGFSPEDADRLRRAMASFKKSGQVQGFRDQFITGMVTRGYPADFAKRCFRQIEGFGTYGFPESHAASFAKLVYVSSWLKCFHPDVFAASLLNSQPMGFYAPAQIVRDAADHGVIIRPPDINASLWDCTLEPLDDVVGNRQRHALRLGFRMIRGLAQSDAERLCLARLDGYHGAHDLWQRARLPIAALERLARADTFRSVGLDRRAALWAIKVLGDQPLPLFAALSGPCHPGHDPTGDGRLEPDVTLPDMALGEHVVMDYASLTLSLKSHPMALLRDGFTHNLITPAASLRQIPPGRRTTIAGLVLVRQRPGSAKGVVFLTVEDESGTANLVVLPPQFETHRREVMGGQLLVATGRVEKDGPHGEVIHLRVERLSDFSHRLRELIDQPLDLGHFPRGRNFH